MATTQEIRSVVDRLTTSWQAGPPVAVVANVAALPFPAPSDAEGALHRGQVLLVADTLDADRAAQVLAHEAIGHHGLRRALGSSWRGFLTGVLAGTRADPQLRAARQRVELVYADGALRPHQVADEVAAAAVERLLDLATGRMAVARPVTKQAAAVAGHLKREVLLMDHPVCSDQLQGALLLAERQVRVGGRFLGLRARAARWYARGMAFDPSKPPMSLQESQHLLEQAGHWRDAFGELWLFGQLILGALLIIGGIGALGFWILRALFS